MNGWYVMADAQTINFNEKPIATVADFENLLIESNISVSGDTIYQIVGKIRNDKIHIWADATEKSIGKQIGFICNGQIISAPQVNCRIENGHFAISMHKVLNPESIYQLICKERFEAKATTYKYWINSIMAEMTKSSANKLSNVIKTLYVEPMSFSLKNIKSQYSVLENALYKELQTSSLSSSSSDYMRSKEYIEYKKFIHSNPVSISFMLDGFLFSENTQGLYGYLIDDIILSVYPNAKSINAH